MKTDCTSQDFVVMKFKFMSKLASWTLAVWTLYFFLVSFIPIPKENLPNVNVILGFLILEIGIMVGYYFGSSQSTSSRQLKDDAQDPVEAAAKAEAAKLEVARIEAARVEAEKAEAARLEAAKVEAAKVIEAAKNIGGDQPLVGVDVEASPPKGE